MSSSRDAEMIRHRALLNRVSVLTSLRESRAMMRTWAILRVTRPRESVGCGGKRQSTIVPDEICSLPTTLRADLSGVTFRREESP